jgi:beta-phosphoglucomutase
MSIQAKNDAGVFSQNTPAQQTLQAVIWDLDGVIVDSSKQHRQSWQLLAAETGVSFTDEDFWATFGRSNAAIIPLHWGAQLTPVQIDDLANRKEVYFRDILRKEGLKALPGALELMQEAKVAGLKQSLASSTPVENIKVVSELLGLERWLDAFVSGDRLPRGKPAPDVFLLAAKALGMEPTRSVVIEDAPAGVAAAKAAEMRCLAVTTSHPAAALVAADRIVDSLAHIHVEALQALMR